MNYFTAQKSRHRLIAWKSRQALLLSVLAVIYMVSIYASSGAAHAASTTVTVTMTDKPPTYLPGKLTIKAGTTVEWKNTAATLHDVTTDSSAVQNAKDVSLPPGAKPFDSGFMPPGGTWSYTFSVPGHYVYACIPHEKDHMLGEITVTK